MQSSSNELGSPIPVCVNVNKCIKFSSFTLNSYAHILTASDCEVVLSYFRQVVQVSIPT